ncbi:exosortase C-terminal domain/associated protein EpsI [Gemmatimonadota bacterium]
MRPKTWWVPAVFLSAGVILTSGVSRQRSLPLVAPLGEALFSEFMGYQARDVPISEAEAAVAGFSDYLYRIFEPAEGTVEEGDSVQAPEGVESSAIPWFSVYVGYYESQAQGNTIHSPKNCLPGSGWEALSSRAQPLDSPGNAGAVNRYVLQNDNERALVLYWYQGRGRIAHDEYLVKLDLLRDAALRRRSDEALVRVVVPVVGGEAASEEMALRIARKVATGLKKALPAG